MTTTLGTTPGTTGRIASAAAVGALAGLAWAAALRAYMAEINSALSMVTWIGTFVGVLAPGVIVGAALGISAVVSSDGRGRTALVWCSFAPLVFALVPLAVPGQLSALLETGLGSGAIGVALGGLAGGYAIGGRRRWLRLLLGALALIVLAGTVATVPTVGGDELAASTPRGLWIMLLTGSLLILFALAASIPFRRLRVRPPGRGGSRAGRAPAATELSTSG